MEQAELGPSFRWRGEVGQGHILPIYESFVLGLEKELAKSKQSGGTFQVERVTTAEQRVSL